MTDFQNNPSRDATHVIGGFLFQIQITIVRWLDLSDDEELILECGEDIDKVVRHETGIEIVRELEQVKLRSQRFSLATASVIAVLVNFANHIASNPGKKLRLRYTTTATPAREMGSDFDSRTCGVDVWNSIVKRGNTGCDADKTGELVALLRRAQKPASTKLKDWKTYLNILNADDPTVVHEFIGKIEWSYGHARPAINETQIKSRIHDLFGHESDILYDCLVAGVLRLLANDGPKILTKGMLDHTIQQRSLTALDRERLVAIELIQAAHGEKIEQLQAEIALGTDRREMLLFGSILDDDIGIRLTNVLDQPMLVERVVHRNKTVSSIIDAHSGQDVIVITGSYAEGKSHLAILITQALRNEMYGLCLRDLSDLDACKHLERTIENEDIWNQFRLADCPLLILDDLPPVSAQSRLALIITSLLDRAITSGAKVIVTTHRPLPRTITDSLQNSVTQFPVPAFADEEVRELFIAHGCSEDLLTREKVSTWNSLCSGHPLLLTALARTLAQSKSKSEDPIIGILADGEHRTEVNFETAQAILNSVSAKQCRELLYRMALSSQPLGESDVLELARIEPQLAGVTTCLTQLDGLWLRRSQNGRFDVSPLVRQIQNELGPNTLKEAHSAIARQMISRRSLTYPEFAQAIMSYCVAGETEIAIHSLLKTYLQYPANSMGYDAVGALVLMPPSMPRDIPLWSEMPLRAMQIVSALVEDMPSQPYLERLMEIVSVGSDRDCVGAVQASHILLSAVKVIPTSLAILGTRIHEQAIESTYFPSELSDVVTQIDSEQFIAIVIFTAKTWQDLHALSNWLGERSDFEKNQIQSNPVIRESLRGIFFRPMFTTSRDNSRLVNNAAEKLEKLEESFRLNGLEYFAAFTATGKLVVLGEYERDSNLLYECYESLIKKYSQSTDACALFSTAYGQQLVYLGEHDKGYDSLAAGLRSTAAICGFERANRLLDIIVAGWYSARPVSRHRTQLRKMIQSSHFGGGETLCRMHSVLGVSYWSDNNKLLAYSQLQKALRNWLDITDESTKKHLGVALGHALSYYSTVERTGNPPPSCRTGEEFMDPHPGMFIGENDDMANLWYGRHNRPYLLWLMASLVIELNKPKDTNEWIERAWTAAREANSIGVLSLLSPYAVITALEDANIAAAFEAARMYGESYLCLSRPSVTLEMTMQDDYDPNETAKPRTDEDEKTLSTQSLWIFNMGLCVYYPRVYSDSATKSHQFIKSISDVIRHYVTIGRLEKGWLDLVNVISGCTSVSMNRQEIRSMLEYESKQLDTDTFQMLSHVLLSFRSDASVGQRAISHSVHCHQMEGFARTFGTHRLDRMFSAISKYWQTQLTESRFDFRNPRIMELHIEDFKSLPPINRVKNILKVVLESEGARVSADHRSWLDR